MSSPVPLLQSSAEPHKDLDGARSANAKTQNSPSICPLCAQKLRTRFAAVRDAKTLQSFAILECPKCELGCTSPKPEDLTKYYQNYHGGRHGITDSFCARRRLRILQKVCNAPGKRLLDIGCGEGTFLLAAKAKGWDVAGTEMNPSIARAMGLEVQAEMAALKGQTPFDCITLWHSLEHMPDPQATLREARNLLALNGVLIIAVPDSRGLQARVCGSNWLHLDVPRHLYHFSRPSLEKLLRAEHFAPIREWHQEFEYDLLGWSQSLLNFRSAKPNLFFDLLTGRRIDANLFQRMYTWAAGLALTGLAIPLVPLGAVMEHGGTVIIAARRC